MITKTGIGTFRDLHSKAPGDGEWKTDRVDVVCIIGERVYHASGSSCHRELNERGQVLALTEAQAHEVGMEPCGFCMGGQTAETPKRSG